jgi:hypothetical protein
MTEVAFQKGGPERKKTVRDISCTVPPAWFHRRPRGVLAGMPGGRPQQPERIRQVR